MLKQKGHLGTWTNIKFLGLLLFEMYVYYFQRQTLHFVNNIGHYINTLLQFVLSINLINIEYDIIMTWWQMGNSFFYFFIFIQSFTETEMKI